MYLRILNESIFGKSEIEWVDCKPLDSNTSAIIFFDILKNNYPFNTPIDFIKFIEKYNAGYPTRNGEKVFMFILEPLLPHPAIGSILYMPVPVWRKEIKTYYFSGGLIPFDGKGTINFSGDSSIKMNIIHLFEYYRKRDNSDKKLYHLPFLTNQLGGFFVIDENGIIYYDNGKSYTKLASNINSFIDKLEPLK